MPNRDFDDQMQDWYRDETRDGASHRLAERVTSIPDTEPEPITATRRWRLRLGRWFGAGPDPTRGGSDQHSPPPREDRRNRLVITTAATLTVALAVGAGALLVAQPEVDDTRPADQTFQADFTSDAPPAIDDFMSGLPVWIDQCDARDVSNADRWENDVDVPDPDGHDRGVGPGGLDIMRGQAWVADWEAQAPGLGVGDPRLTGLYSETISVNQGAGGLLAVATGRLENDDGAWEGSYVMFSDYREPSQVTIQLEGEGAYDGLTALISNPELEVRELGAPNPRAGCQRLKGFISERPLPPAPPALVTGGEAPPPANAIELSLTDAGIEPANPEIVWADEAEHVVMVTNTGTVEHGIAVMEGDEWDPDSVIAGGDDELLAPGETRLLSVFFEPFSPYTIFDPTDREGTAIVVEVTGFEE